uniref:Uncharacterized protein n=1 Tax=Opuntia streptacantha TaxID=393608 RepID=A0A7C9CFI2_OPUST
MIGPIALCWSSCLLKLPATFRRKGRGTIQFYHCIPLWTSHQKPPAAPQQYHQLKDSTLLQPRHQKELPLLQQSMSYLCFLCVSCFHLNQCFPLLLVRLDGSP